jgi:phosphatidylglycerol lysyltransferase
VSQSLPNPADAEFHDSETVAGEFDRSLGLLRRYGINSFSGCLLYDSVLRHHLSCTDGFVGYLDSRHVLVTLGEPVCSPEMFGDAASEFVDFARAHRKSVAFIAVGRPFLDAVNRMGPTWIYLGEDFIYDVPTYVPRGDHAKKVRSARNQLLRNGGHVREVRPDEMLGTPLEGQLRDIAASWLRARNAFQMHLLDLDLMKLAEMKRYFYVVRGGDALGFLSCLPILGRNGFLFEDLVRHPTAPPGTTEVVVLEAIRVFKAEGYDMAAFGLSPMVDPARSNLVGASRIIAGVGVGLANRFAHLRRLHHYRKKYHTGRSEPCYLVKFPRGIGIGEVWGILQAFNLA